MVNIDTRPEQVGKVIAYRENSLELEYIIVGDLTGVTVAVELQDSSGMKLYSVETFERVDNSVFINFTKEQVAKMPAIAKCQVILNGVYRNGFEIKPDRGFGIPSNTSATVQINLKGEKGDTGDITPEAAALALQINNQALQAEADFEAIGLAAEETETIRQAVAADKDIVLEAREEVITAIAHLKKGYVVGTKAALTALIATPNLDFCDITVLADESYEGLLSEYFWNKATVTQKFTF